MSYKTGTWGEEAKERSLKRREYFREYRRLHPRIYRYVKGKMVSITSSDRTVDASNDDSIGMYGEKVAMRKLEGATWIGRPYDLDWKGKRIDVKTSLPKPYGIRGKYTYYRWKFWLRQKGKVDAFLLLCLDKERKLQRLYYIPDNKLEVSNITIQCERRYKAPESYDQYEISIV